MFLKTEMFYTTCCLKKKHTFVKSQLQNFMIVQGNKPARTNFLVAPLAMLRIPTNRPRN